MKRSEFEQRFADHYHSAQGAYAAARLAEEAGVTWDPEEPEPLTPKELAERASAIWQVWATPSGHCWGARLEGAQTTDGERFYSPFALGITPLKAMEQYCRTVLGRTLIFGNYPRQETRREVKA